MTLDENSIILNKSWAKRAEAVLWNGLEDMCVQHGSIRCNCEKTAETEWPNTPFYPDEPF